MIDFPECEHLNVHRRRICRNERTDLSRAMVNRYRVAWGVAPLPDDPCEEAVVANADSTPASPLPSFFQRVVTFAGAVQSHLRDGLTKCDEGEIQRRLEICQDCPSFTGTHCRECGCSCSSTNTYFNKLAWRSEKCPLGRW